MCLSLEYLLLYCPCLQQIAQLSRWLIKSNIEEQLRAWADMFVT
jgi:hypothetical protein